MVHASVRWTIVLLALLCMSRAAIAQDAKPAGEERLDIAFAKWPDAYPNLRLFGADAETLTKVEPQGFRITMPVVRDGAGDIGLELQKTLRGDFEITLGYELIVLPTPGPDGGAGIVLEAHFDTPDSAKVRLARTQKTKGAFFGSTYYTVADNGRLTAQPQKYPRANEKIKTGRLRLVRSGAEVAFQIDEVGAGFQTIATKDAGGADVMFVRAFATSGYKPFLVDLRITSLNLRWNTDTKIAVLHPQPINPAPQPQAAAPVESNTRIWLFVALGLAFLLLILLAGGVVLVLLLRRKQVVTPKPSATPATALVFFTCPACRKNLKATATLAGKRVKCSQCGKPATVPNDTSEVPAN